MKSLKKTIAVLLAVTMSLLCCPAAFAASGTPSITASSGVAMDFETGEILYAKDIDTMRVPASMTKIMTAYIIYQEIEKGTITKDSLFTISDNARRISNDSSYPTSVPLAGSTISVDQALKNIMVPSASGTCVVAAENIAGSEAAFVERMNATAKELDMDAEYWNCHGARVHYISARSIALLIRAFISEYPDILNYSSLTSITYNGTTYSNTNKLLTSYYYEGADGFKTGTLAEAGYCLSSTAKRNGRRIITVVMNASSTAARHTDSIALLNYGFQEAARRDTSRAGANMTFIPQVEALRIGADTSVTVKFTNVPTPFRTTLEVKFNGAVVAKLPTDVEEGSTRTFAVYAGEELTGRDSVELSVSYPLADGTAHTVSNTLAISDEAVSPFRDTAYNWAKDNIEKAYAESLIRGYSDRTFRPETPIARAEFAALMLKAIDAGAASDVETVTEEEPDSDEKASADVETPAAEGVFEEEETPVVEPEPVKPNIEFTDMEDHWAKDIVSRLAALGIVNGSNGAFHPDDNISRQEAAVMISRILGDGQITGADFTDMSAVSDWAVPSVRNVKAQLIMTGYDDGSFRPNAMITRAESVTLLMRTIAGVRESQATTAA